MTADRVMPHDLDAERSVLGGILMDNQRLHDATEHVKPTHFFRAAHQRLFEAMVDLGAPGRVIDLVTLKAELSRTGDLERVGGPAYVASLVDGVPRSTNVGHYARIVREKASLRELIIVGQRLVTRAYEAHDDATEILDDAERAILGLADRTVTAGFEPMRTIAYRSLEILERAYNTKQMVSGVPSGLADLDALTRGFQPGSLVVIGARPGMGKTSLASNIAQHAASAGRVVAQFSLEMSNDELFVRQLAAVARIDSHRLQSGYIGESEWGRLSRAIATLAELSLYSDETPAIAVFAIRSRLRRLKAERGLDLVVIDYLQLLTGHGKRETRALEIAGMTASLKSLARELKVPILLLAQLNRDSVKGDVGRRPRLSDLKDSGSIEQDADVVLLLHRHEDEAAAGDSSMPVELILAKHRNGPTGTVRLAWYEQQTRFAGEG